MMFADAIKDIRQNSFLSQVDFAKEIGVSFSTVNRWETGKAIPNCVTMKKIANFCDAHSIDYKQANASWKESR